MKQFSILKQTLIIGLVFIATNVWAQQKSTKISKSIKVNKDIALNLNTSHCNIVFDTWNKDVVEVEAYIEGDNLSKEEIENALKSWNVTVDATKSSVSITATGNAPVDWANNFNPVNDDAYRAVLDELKFELADLPVVDLELPELPEIPKAPEMPELPELPKGINNIHFDYDAYKKDGDAYMKQWSKDFESTFGEEYAKKMEAWGEKFGKEWNEKYAKEMEAWGEQFGKEWEESYSKKMEAWGERYAKQMEERAKRLELQTEALAKRQELYGKMQEQRAQEREKMADERAKLADERRAKIEKMIHSGTNPKVKKTIKIRMPKDTKVKVNVKYGELKFASNIDNLKADLSHTKFIATSINGSNTSINASYSPVLVTNWNLGSLNINYVKDAKIDNVKQLELTSNSSNIKIDNLISNATIHGSIGDLEILKIDDAFSNLNITLQNSDAVIALPKVDYGLQYMGTKSRFSHPLKKPNDNASSFSMGHLNSSKNIVVNAKYSNITMK